MSSKKSGKAIVDTPAPTSLDMDIDFVEDRVDFCEKCRWHFSETKPCRCVAPVNSARAHDCPATGKRSYTSAAAARRAVRSSGRRLRVYLCPDCGRWHQTKSQAFGPKGGARRLVRPRKKYEED